MDFAPGYRYIFGMTKPGEDEVILVALVDDDRVSREEHFKHLNLTPGVSVISVEATLNVTMLTEEQPDVVIMDAGNTDVASLRAAVTARRLLPDASVVITDLEVDNAAIASYVKAGVKGFVVADADVGKLVDTVLSVADGAHVLPGELTSPLFVQIAADGIVLDDDESGEPVRAKLEVTLTLREREVIALLGEGLRNKQIAARMCISLHTVKAHLRSAMQKTGLRTRVLLALSGTAEEK